MGTKVGTKLTLSNEHRSTSWWWFANYLVMGKALVMAKRRIIVTMIFLNAKRRGLPGVGTYMAAT